MWEFLDYVTDSKKVPIEIWATNHLSKAERAEFDLAVDYMQRIDDWDTVKKAKKKYEELQRDLAGLTELKFSTTTRSGGRNHRKQFRPLGILIRQEKRFIFLGGFQKGRPGSPPIPSQAFTLALRYKREYEDRRGNTRVHKT